MPGRREQRLGRPRLDDAAQVHHRDPLGDLPHDGEVVGDEEVGQPAVALQVGQQVEHLRLHRDVERRDRLVADDEARLDRERPRDPDALALATGELVRDSASAYPGSSPTSSSSAATRRPTSAPRASRWISMPSATAAPTVMRGLSALYGSWKMICIRRRSAPQRGAVEREDVGALERRLPAVGSCSRRMVRPTDDLPHPLSPTSASVSPRPTSNDTPSTARTGGRRGRKRPPAV